MAVSKVIDQNNKVPKAQDYAFLRKEGISLIQSLSGEIWTDYNTHDPGITLLEAMCYALTDLGYRASYDMKDILATERKSSDSWKDVFYTARRILPCNPLTLLDYRKLIIDTEGVRNAWIEKSDEYEILLFLQENGKEYFLTYDARRSDEIIRLRGLYKVFVEFEEQIIDESKQDEVTDIIRKKLQYHRNLCEDFVSVASVDYEKFPIEAIVQINEGSDMEMINARIYKVIQDFFSPPVKFYSLEQMMEKKASSDEIFQGPVLKYGFIDTDELIKSERFKNIHLSDIIHLISGIEGVIAVKKFTFGNSPSPFANFTEWINDVKDKQKAPKLDISRSNVIFDRIGDRHRDESAKQPNKKRVKDIFSFLQAGDFKTKLKGETKDLQVPEGEFMNIAEYYPFQKSLPTMYGMNETFIDTAIDNSTIMNAVNDLLDKKVGNAFRTILNRFLNETLHEESIQAVISLFENPSPDIAFSKQIIDKLLIHPSDFELMKTLTVEKYNVHETQKAVKDQLYKLVENHSHHGSTSDKSRNLQAIAIESVKKSLIDIGDPNDVMKLKESYIKLQVATLQIRKRNVLQLRGFLMVFEQIMADFLSQLEHTKELLSFGEVKQTYFPGALKGVNDLEALFINLKNYNTTQLSLIENEGAFVKKRNAILNHLMSRFSESMENYSLFMKQYLGKKSGRRVIGDKMKFLSDYIEISGYRGKAYEYIHSDQVWDSNNVEGLKKRICKLLGIENYSRRTIATESIAIKKIEPGGITKYVVELTDPHNKEHVLLRSKHYDFESEARVILTYILEQGIGGDIFEHDGKKNKWEYKIKRATQENDFEPVATGEVYETREQRDEALKKTLQTLADISNDENFHLVEHILFRPKIGPREELKKSSAPDNRNAVELLRIRLIPEKRLENTSNVEEVHYRFKEKQVKDTTNKNATIWKLSLLKDEIEFLDVNEEFIFYTHLTRRLKHIREFGANASNYIKTIRDGNWVFTIRADGRYLAESKRNYSKSEDIDLEIAGLVDFFSYEHGFVNEVVDDESILYNADPYSLQISVFVPSWHQRFRDPAFKHLFEKTIFMETPAHIYPHVYWLDHKEMKEFEEAYKFWIQDMAASDIPNIDTMNKMILKFNELTK